MENNLKELNNTLLAMLSHRKVKGEELDSTFNLDPRSRYEWICQLRHQGYPILAEKNKDGGYFIANSQAEVEKWVSSQQREIRKTEKMLNAMMDYFNKRNN